MLTSAPITHVIFDMDGTLVDSESLLYTALDVVCDKFDKPVRFDIKEKLLGHPFKERIQQLYKDLNFKSSELTIGQFINELIMNCMAIVEESGMKLMPGARRLVEYFKSNNIPMAIASGNDRHSYDGTAGRFGDFFDSFNHAVLAGDKSQQILPKPDPDVYLRAYQQFQPLPESAANVLVFEDNEVGCRAAIGAGMSCVLVIDERLNSTTESSLATLVIKSLADFRPEMFGLQEI
ncbi:pseudouridine-5'-phosphatase-like [Oppia nitens]|uniref:pseudouridine-5'-phosphatase-like n=1 Tax=Oppia nitens TaxID=1686743 RepID=UPI0023DB2C41|nr:pseudouridine-5'-phosphatase-like [Oppia nitens]XP_054156734.1 pseudouridine-5'-phosphatase-like [Oppia nitens]